MKYNAYCIKCGSVVVDKEKARCPKCKGKIEIKGIVLRVTADNGEFPKHL